MINLSKEQKISFLKILFSFANMDGSFSSQEESAISMLKDKVFKIDIRDSEYKIFLNNFEELSLELQKLDIKTQKILFEILEEILDNNKYDDSKFYKKSKRETQTQELFKLLQKESQCC